MPTEQAHALYAQGQYEQVVNLLLPLCRAVESITSPSTINAQGFSLLARAYANQGLLSDAQHWGEQAIHNDQSNPTLQYTLATIFLAQERTSDAIRALREALSLNPNFGLAHFALGNLLQQQQRHEEAGYHLASALAVLQQTQSDEIVPASEGLTAGRLTELINVMLLR
jgi:chemotaxis protein methyltransferase CheR